MQSETQSSVFSLVITHQFVATSSFAFAGNAGRRPCNMQGGDWPSHKVGNTAMASARPIFTVPDKLNTLQLAGPGNLCIRAGANAITFSLFANHANCDHSLGATTALSTGSRGAPS